MAVIMVAGNSPQFPGRLTDGIRTLTATIALEMGYAQGRHNRILFSVGIVLFIMILILNSIILILKRHVTEES
jgi:phosphate transport system permease protein